MGALVQASRQNISLMVHDPKPGTKAVEVRRAIVQLPEVTETLNNVEKYILAASCKPLISEMEVRELAQKCAQMFQFIARDVGYIIPKDGNDAAYWAYTQTRLVDVLKKYYDNMTLADVKMAFEMLITGGLDEYLPKDKNGKVEKHHFQQFNVEYLSKVLNAYRLKQSEVFNKAYNAVPKPKNEVTEEEKEYFAREAKTMWRNQFLRYKYTGFFYNTPIGDKLIYDWLVRIGYADEVQGSAEQKEKAFAEFMQKAAQGLVNYYTAHNVRKQGIDAIELEFPAFSMARRNEIKRAFDEMIKDEIFIDYWL